MKPNRLTIRNLMILIAGVAVLLAIGKALGYFVHFVLIWFTGPVWLGLLAWRVGLKSPGPALAGLVVLAIPASLATAWFCVYPMEVVGPVIPFVIAWSASPVLAGCALGWIMARRRREGTKGSPPGSLVVGALAGLPLSMALSFWPLHLAFQMARPEMIRLADQVAAGKPVSWPHQAGIYQVVAVTIDPDHPVNYAILLDKNPNWPSGFVRLVEPTDPMQNLGMVPSDYQIDLGDGWAYWREE